MITSKGGKIQYFCPACRSPNIEKVEMWQAFGPTLFCWSCDDCGQYGPWYMRLKQSLQTGKVF